MELLKTKYSRPEPNKRQLPRHSFNHKLEESFSRKLTTITAPAGYGKTTAVLQWLENVALPAAWLSIDAADNEPIAFWHYCCAALDGISKGAAQDTEYVFAARELFKSNVHLSILINRLADFGQDFFLVLDDFHLIKNREILDAFSYFISYLPSSAHLVLIGRVEPDLKLTKLGLKEDLLKIAAQDLIFNAEEIDQYFKIRGYSLKKEELRQIEDYTEGWAAALVAVALSLKDDGHRNSVISNLGSCNQRIEDYLVEDVLHAWSVEQRDFMEKASILDKLYGPLCQAVTGYDGDRLLKELYDQNSFLVALDQEASWFRFHHLFVDFLRKKLSTREPDFIRDLHLKAGEWLTANGFHAEAVEHFLDGARYEEVLKLMDKFWRHMTNRGEYAQLFSWIQRLPDPYALNSPLVMLVESFCYVSREDYRKAWERLKRLEYFMETNAPVSEILRKDYMVANANFFLNQGDIKSLVSAIKNAAAYSLDANIDYIELNLYDISAYRANTYLFIKILQKNPAQFHVIAKNHRSLIRINSGYEPLIAGELDYERGKLDEALPKLTAAVGEAINAVCAGALVPAMVALAKIKRAHGDIPGAVRVIAECESRGAAFLKPHWHYMLKAFKARLDMDSGNPEMVDNWVKESKLSLFREITLAREYELIVMARTLISQQRYHDADILLNRLSSFAEGKKRTHSLVEITNLLAITALKNLDEEAAGKHLEKALAIGKKEGYVRSFVDELAPMVTLLEMYLKKHKQQTGLGIYARELLSQTKDSVRHSIFPANSIAIETLLTPLEKKVLHLIINAYTNKDIADTLGITLRTVKAHTGSIYKKLNIKTRTQCIKKAGGMFA